MTATSTTAVSLAAAHDTISVAFQGERGAYGDEAIAQHWRGAATAIPSLSFEQVVAHVASGLAGCGMIPVWNTIIGEIAQGSAVVRASQSATYGLTVTGAVSIVVRHQLLGLPESSLGEIASVASHPVALAQCERFLAQHPGMVSKPVYDTAGAARDLAINGTLLSAAIAGSLAAERYGLVTLAENIQNIPHNITRFLILARAGNEGEASGEIEAGWSVRW